MPHVWYHTKDDVETSPFQAGLGKLFETGLSVAAAKAMQDDIPSTGEVAGDAYKAALEYTPQLGVLSREESLKDAEALLNRRLQYDQPFAEQDWRLAEH